MFDKSNIKGIEQSLQNMRFPAAKNDLMRFARDERASQAVVNAISSIPDREYSSPLDAAKAYASREIKDRPMGLDSCDD
ncbi:MAG: DUF2795 domain-containing protein [Chitinispirillales bacterium]|jgi:hypothetical protein|nr:DUF2795 domain-containing protein [Chitinispirillales bacterium]